MKTWRTGAGTTVTEVIGGRCHCFLVSTTSHCVLVDSGRTNRWEALSKRLDELRSTHGCPTHLVLTHTHFDHAENAANLRHARGLRVIVHRAEAAFLESGDSPLPAGTVLPTRLLMRVADASGWPDFRYAAAPADVVVADAQDLAHLGEQALAGFSGASLLPTPGHSAGSMSLIVDREIALVGDAAFGVFPGSAFPPFADDPPRLVQSWRALLDTGATLFLPAHGGAIPRSVLQRDFEKRSARLSTTSS